VGMGLGWEGALSESLLDFSGQMLWRLSRAVNPAYFLTRRPRYGLGGRGHKSPGVLAGGQPSREVGFTAPQQPAG
jgi:hypothetical protein